MLAQLLQFETVTSVLVKYCALCENPYSLQMMTEGHSR